MYFTQYITVLYLQLPCGIWEVEIENCITTDVETFSFCTIGDRCCVVRYETFLLSVTNFSKCRDAFFADRLRSTKQSYSCCQPPKAGFHADWSECRLELAIYVHLLGMLACGNEI